MKFDDLPSQLRLSPASPSNSDSFEVIRIDLPGSKSYTNRALLLSSMVCGKTTLENALFSDDTHYMVQCLRELGASIEVDQTTRTMVIEGCGKPAKQPDKPLYCGNAGTAIRFLTPYCALGKGAITLTGDERMQQRPIEDLLSALRQLGVSAVSVKDNGCPPIRIEGSGFQGGNCRMPGDRSSQYFSALLLCAPATRDGISIEVDGDLVSKPYLDMTLDILKRFGVTSTNRNYQLISVPGQQTLQGMTYQVEGDASGASYFLAAAAVSGGKVALGPLPYDTVQGDIGMLSILSQMGCEVLHHHNTVELTGGDLCGIEIDMHHMSDIAQTVAVVALFAKGPTRITNIANARIKETDRISAMAEELVKLGAGVEEFSDGLVIHPRPRFDYHPAVIQTYQDHRMAMSFAVAGIRIPGLVIDQPRCVSKTFPNFFELFAPWVQYES